VPHGARLVLVANDADEVASARLRLARVGIENVVGYLDGGLAEWVRDGRPVGDVTAANPAEFAALGVGGAAAGAGLRVLDVRRAGEFALGHVPGAANAPLEAALAAGVAGQGAARVREAFGLPAEDDGRPVALACQSGYRSTIAAALLRPAVKGPLVNLSGGTTAWAAAGLPLDAPKGPEAAAPR